MSTGTQVFPIAVALSDDFMGHASWCLTIPINRLTVHHFYISGLSGALSFRYKTALPNTFIRSATLIAGYEVERIKEGKIPQLERLLREKVPIDNEDPSYNGKRWVVEALHFLSEHKGTNGENMADINSNVSFNSIKEGLATDSDAFEAHQGYYHSCLPDALATDHQAHNQ